MKVGQVNVRSMFTGFVEFKHILLEQKFDVLFLTETWLRGDVDGGAFHIDGFNFFRRDRAHGRGGGVAAYVRQSFLPGIISFDFPINPNLEYLALRVKIKKRSFCFGVFYRPPHTNVGDFMSDVDDIVSSLSTTTDEILITGDFNINLFNLNNPLTTSFESYNLFQVINEPTRITNTTSTLLDPIFVSNPELVLSQGTISVDTFSDHRMVFCNLRIEKSRIEPRMVKFRSFRAFNVNAFLRDLNALPLCRIVEANHIDDKVEIFNALVLGIFDKHAPIKEVRITKPKAPWMSENLKEFMRQRDRALQAFKLSKSAEDWEIYKRLRNFTLSMVRENKKRYLDDIYKEKNHRKTWQALRTLSVCGDDKRTLPPNLSDPDEISKYFGPFFRNVANCDESINYFNTHKFKQNNDLFSFGMTTVEEVNSIIKSIKTDSSGIDGISASMLRYCSPIIDIYIVHIVNCCIEANYFPSRWKVSLGKPIPKCPSPTDYGDLRIISILPVLSKIIEKILYSQIYSYVLSNNILPDSQCGFRRNYSTSVALAAVLDDIIKACDNQMCTVLVLLDFSRAFDTINQGLLCSKLRYYGFSDASIGLIESFFTLRYQHICYGNKSSEQIPIFTGVPQGSILGPLLFLIYTADILKALKNCKLMAYADDTQLYFSFEDHELGYALERINGDLSLISRLASANSLKLNPTKSTVVLFGNKNRVSSFRDRFRVTLDGEQLPVVEKAKNLGVVVDSEIRFRDHVTRLVQKSFMSLKVLYSCRHFLNRPLRKNLCESLVLSNFNYCDFVYGYCIDKVDQYRIQKVQNMCCRLIFGLRKFDHVSQKIIELGWLNMENRRLLHLTSFTLRILNSQEASQILKSKLIFRHSIHSRNVRRPNKLTMPRHRAAIYRRSFTYNAVKVFNALDVDFTSLPPHLFKKKYKEKLLLMQKG